MAKPQFKKLEREYARMLASLSINKNIKGSVTRAANRIKTNKSRYVSIQTKTGVPWQIVAVIHKMETGLSFSRHLHNGDTLKRKTRRVPAGRPTRGTAPFTWEESAIDAIKYMRLHKVRNWTMERMCYELERYNGWGYRTYHPSTKSPYLWSGSSHYRRGKYVADGKWSSSAVSKQLGAIPVLIKLMDGQPTLTDDQVVKKSTKLTTLGHIKKFIAVSVPALLGLFTMETFELASGFIGDLTIMMKSNAVLIMAGMLVFGWLVSDYIKKKTIKDYKDGRYKPSGDK